MEIEILNEPFPTQYWAVGEAYGSVNNQVTRFLNLGIWEDGWGAIKDKRLEPKLDLVNPDDIFVMKSCFAQGKVVITRVKGVGIVQKRINSYAFKIDWLNKKELRQDFEGISYRVTIEPLRYDKVMEYANTFLKK